MSETRENLETLIEESQEAIDKAKRKLKDLEITYSIGDRFITQHENKFILAGAQNGEILLIALETGYCPCRPTKVEGSGKITQRELELIGCRSKLTRYWDSQRKELTR